MRGVLAGALSVTMVGLCACTDGTKPGAEGMTIVWTAPARTSGGEWVNGAPASEAGRVYFQEGNELLARDAATGALLWARPVRHAPSPPPTTLLARDGRVYLSETDSVMAIDGATGHTIWTMHPDSQAVVAPALDATTLYTGQRGLPVVYALDLSSGAVRWRVNIGTGFTFPALVGGIAVRGDTAYVTMQRRFDPNGVASAGVLVALATSDGHELWRYETTSHQAEFFDAPILTDRLVIVNEFTPGNLLAIDIGTHQLAWQSPVGGAVGMVRIGNVIVSAGVDAQVHAVDIATGTSLWTGPTGSSAFGAGACGGSAFASSILLRRFDLGTGVVTGEISGGNWISQIATDGTRAFVAGSAGSLAVLCDH